MSDTERNRRNAQKLREIVNLIETRTLATLGVSEHFDVAVSFSIKDKAIQRHVEVEVRFKDKLDSEDRQ